MRNNLVEEKTGTGQVPWNKAKLLGQKPPHKCCVSETLRNRIASLI